MRSSDFKRTMVRASPCGVAAACAVLAGCAEPERLIVDNWARPGEVPIGREYTPQEANRRGISGWVLLSCTSAQDQTSTNCFVIVETPSGWGFGPAALRSSQATQVRDAANYGGHVPTPGEQFNLPIFFCPAEKRPDCQVQTRAEVTAFLPKLAAVRRMLRAKDCEGAIAGATETGTASFIALTTSECARLRGAPVR